MWLRIGVKRRLGARGWKQKLDELYVDLDIIAKLKSGKEE